jgi:hypothetical protein
MTQVELLVRNSGQRLGKEASMKFLQIMDLMDNKMETITVYHWLFSKRMTIDLCKLMTYKVLIQEKTHKIHKLTVLQM